MGMSGISLFRLLRNVRSCRGLPCSPRGLSLLTMRRGLRIIRFSVYRAEGEFALSLESPCSRFRHGKASLCRGSATGIGFVRLGAGKSSERPHVDAGLASDPEITCRNETGNAIGGAVVP